MSLYDRFSNEAQFRELFIRPLLNRLNYFGVAEQHGALEFGKDFVFSEIHRLGGVRHYAAQVKHEKTIRQGPTIDTLLSQIRQAFARPFTRPDSPRSCHVSAVYVFNSGDITEGAKEYLLHALTQERFGDNVHFLDGERLSALNEWAALDSYRNVQVRLLGLRISLKAIIDALSHYECGMNLHPLFISGIENYLADPVLADESLLRDLMSLWQKLQIIKTINEQLFKYAGNKSPNTVAFLEKNTQTLKVTAGKVTTESNDLVLRVNKVLESSKPL